MKAIRRYFKRFFSVFSETYTCHICNYQKPIFVMQNIFRSSHRDRSNPYNCCKSCFSMTDETPFFYCEACGQSSPYYEMTQMPNQVVRPPHKMMWVHLGECPTDDLQISQRTAELERQGIYP